MHASPSPHTPGAINKTHLPTYPSNPREFHGCPYKHFDEANLNKLLERSGISVGDRDEMLRLAKGQVRAFACTFVFLGLGLGWMEGGDGLCLR